MDVPLATQIQAQYIDKIDDMIQSMVKHMVEKVEMNVVMLMAGIKKRAYVDEFVRNVDDELSDLRHEIVSEATASSPTCRKLAQKERSPSLGSKSVCDSARTSCAR